MKRSNFYDGQRVFTDALTYSQNSLIGGIQDRMTDLFVVPAVLDGLCVGASIFSSGRAYVTAGTAYDINGDRVEVPSNTSDLAYNGGSINAAAGTYHIVARYAETNDGIVGVGIDGTTHAEHVIESYALTVKKSGSDSLSSTDVRVADIVVTSPGSSFIVDMGPLVRTPLTVRGTITQSSALPSSASFPLGVTAGTVTVSSLTAGRVPYAGPSGLLVDDASLTFSGSQLTASKGISTNALTVSGFIKTGAGVVFPDGTTQTTAGGGGGLTIGNAVSGGGADRVLYENGAQQLAASASFTFASDILTVPTVRTAFGSASVPAASFVGACDSGFSFTAGTLASVVIEDLTYTARRKGTAGNSVTIEYIVSGFSTSVSVSGNAITVDLSFADSSADQVRAAIDASAAASALVSVVVSGTGSDLQSVQGPTSLAGGTGLASIGTSYDGVLVSTVGANGLSLFSGDFRTPGNIAIGGNITASGSATIGGAGAFGTTVTAPTFVITPSITPSTAGITLSLITPAGTTIAGNISINAGPGPGGSGAGGLITVEGGGGSTPNGDSARPGGIIIQAGSPNIPVTSDGGSISIFAGSAGVGGGVASDLGGQVYIKGGLSSGGGSGYRRGGDIILDGGDGTVTDGHIKFQSGGTLVGRVTSAGITEFSNITASKIVSLASGYTFPDGTVQTTAATGSGSDPLTITKGITTNALTSTQLTASALTSARVTFATTGGRLTDNSNLTFDGTVLTAAGATVTQGISTNGITTRAVSNVLTLATLGTADPNVTVGDIDIVAANNTGQDFGGGAGRAGDVLIQAGDLTDFIVGSRAGNVDIKAGANALDPDGNINFYTTGYALGDARAGYFAGTNPVSDSGAAFVVGDHTGVQGIYGNIIMEWELGNTPSSIVWASLSNGASQGSLSFHQSEFLFNKKVVSTSGGFGFPDGTVQTTAAAAGSDPLTITKGITANALTVSFLNAGTEVVTRGITANALTVTNLFGTTAVFSQTALAPANSRVTVWQPGGGGVVSAVALMSGNAADYVYQSLGRATGESFYAVVAAADQFMTGAAAGDTVLATSSTANKILLSSGLNAIPEIRLSDQGVTITTLQVTGQILSASGSVGAPGYSFAGDPDTGVYRTGANALDIVAGGGSLATITSSRIDVGGSGGPTTSVVNLHNSVSFNWQNSTNSSPLTEDGGRSGYLVTASTTNVRINLPTAASSQGRWYFFKKMDSSANHVVICPVGSSLIDGQTISVLSTQFSSLQLTSDGTSWAKMTP